MEVIPRRERLYAAKAGALEAPREDDVAIEPISARGHLREGHADVEGNPRFLGKDLHRPDVADGRHHGIEHLADARGLAREVVLQIVPTAGVRLIAIRELATAPLAAP